VKHLHANGIEFAYLEQGTGPLVLLLHGFPDNARSWSHQLPALAAAGYRAVAPNLRGYPPSEIPTDGFYDRATLAADIAELIRQLGHGQRVHLIGQDWGAAIAYAVLAAVPELIDRAVVMAVPHPAMVARSLLDARHVHHSFHWFFFQLPGLPEQALAANDFAFIDYLWQHWSAPGYEDATHIADIKRMLAEPGALTATLGYYRAMFDPAKADPRLETLRQSMNRPISVPTLALCGGADPRAELMQDQAQYFTGEYRLELVPGAGHFLHREQPGQVNRLILDWLAAAASERPPHS
jgi:pimeloyl-ACP methyl ester carboxylesterase